MKKPDYISPSALQLWQSNPEAYVTKYLCEHRPPPTKQTEPMAVGSAFDAYAKAEIHRRLFGPNHRDSQQFEFATIFDEQVEEQNRDFAIDAGQRCFAAYETSGAFRVLMQTLEAASEEPKMEFTALGSVNEHGGIYAPVKGGLSDNPVVMLGKPDLTFTTKAGLYVIFDWKVNGYCSKSGVSPAAGYVRLRNGWQDSPSTPHTRKHLQAHPSACVMPHMDLTINAVPNLERSKKDWARQLACYGWITGVPVGEEMILAIDQLACKPDGISIAEHRCPVTKEFQVETYEQFQSCWDVVTSDHLFRDMSLEDSQARCTILEGQAKAYYGEHGDFLRQITGRK